MKLTNNQMNIYAYALKKLFNKTEGKLSYVISKNYRVMANELQEYEEIRNQIIEKYGDLDEESGNYILSVNSDGFKNFVEDMKPYDDIECEVNILMLKPEDLYSSTLTAQDISDISFMIDDE